jgi:hypothetical protein
MTDHPITPPPELAMQWFLGAKAMPVDQWVTDVATQAVRWGADQELEACCEWLCAVERWNTVADRLHSARRSKPPSLKEQALGALGRFSSNAHTQASQMTQDFEVIRRAVEQLND